MPIEQKSLRILLWLVGIGFFMQTLDATIVNTTLPAMALGFGESPLRMQSVVVAYSLTMAMLIPASGWLADRFGTRRVYMLAIALFVLGSIACAAAQSLNQLVAARVLQGLGGALLLPVGRLAVLRGFPRDRFLHAMSVIAIPGLVGPLIGPTLGGWLTQGASWHWVFLINIPVGLAGLAATLRYMPDGAQPATKRFDLTGYLYLAFGMMAVSLAVDGLSGLGLKQAGVLVLLVFGMDMASSGNSMLSMVQMLAMSMGVAAAGAVLAAFTSFFGSAGAVHTLHAFQATFACMGLITLASAGIFWQLSPDVRQVKPAEIPES